jgi:hypothetical protein
MQGQGEPLYETGKFLLCLFLVVVELLVALTLQHSLLDYVLAGMRPQQSVL